MIDVYEPQYRYRCRRVRGGWRWYVYELFVEDDGPQQWLCVASADALLRGEATFYAKRYIATGLMP